MKTSDNREGGLNFSSGITTVEGFGKEYLKSMQQNVKGNLGTSVLHVVPFYKTVNGRAYSGEKLCNHRCLLFSVKQICWNHTAYRTYLINRILFFKKIRFRNRFDSVNRLQAIG